MQTFTPLEYIKIHAASVYGLDKETFDVRLKFADDNLDVLEPGKEDELKALTKKAEYPHLFAKAMNTLRGALQGYPVRGMVSMDATASGLM